MSTARDPNEDTSSTDVNAAAEDISSTDVNSGSVDGGGGSGGVDTTPLLNDQIFRSRRFMRHSPSLRGAARFLRRASSRRMMREPSMRVREAAAEQIEERQSDWAYSKPNVILDLIWNLAFIVVSISVLVMSRNESPLMPLRLWILGYAIPVLRFARRKMYSEDGSSFSYSASHL